MFEIAVISLLILIIIVRPEKVTDEHHLFHINKKLRKIMADQIELAAQITTLTDTVTKIGTETRSLLTKIDDLTAVIASGGAVSPELQAAVDALKAQVEVVDALVPDAA